MGETNTSSKHQEREKRILDATAMLIVRYGYDKTSVSDIAKEAGISKGAIYLHFDSKDELLNQLLMRELLRLIDLWTELMLNDTSPKIFSSMYRHVLTILKDNPFLWAMFSRQRWLLGASLIPKANSNVYQQRLGLSKEMLTRLQAVGAIRQDINPETTAYIFNMLNYGYLRLDDVIPPELAPPADEVIHAVGEMVQRHLEPDGDRNTEEARQIIMGFLTGAKQIVTQMMSKS